MMKSWLLSIVLIALSTLTGYAEKPFHKGELIFPLEQWHNHGSSLVESPDGNLIACWFHGSGERKADDVRVLGARKLDGEEDWTEPFLMADTPGYPDCNPVLYVDPQERLWLFWITVLINRWESSLLKYRISSDWQDRDGPPEWDWQDNIHVTPDNLYEDMKGEWDHFLKEFPELIPNLKKEFGDLTADEEVYHYFEKRGQDRMLHRLGWMTRIHPLLLPSGKLLLPLYTDAYSIGIVASTSDWGKTWQTSKPLVGFGNIQPSLVRKNDGTIVAMMRENGPRNRIRIATSKDDGETWSRVGEMEFPNPGSSVEVIRLQNGHWILMYNDTVEGRHSLKLSISDDEGETWKWHRHLELVKPGEGSFSYPSIIQTRDGRIHATYSYRRSGNGKSIKHVEFNEEWVMAGDPQ